jgi:hypothetical protein
MTPSHLDPSHLFSFDPVQNLKINLLFTLIYYASPDKVKGNILTFPKKSARKGA